MKLDLKPLPKSFFKRDTVKVAKALLGKIIKYKKTSGVIIETEAYKGWKEGDEASHAFKRTKRSELMYNTYGKFYIYFIYGNHYCLNITTEKARPGAVLIRALMPLEGIKIMARRRGMKIKKSLGNKCKKDKAIFHLTNFNLTNLTNGPGKLCQALNITRPLNNTNINHKIKVLKGIKIKNSQIFCSSRIGIRKAQHLKWRFFIKHAL